LRRFVQWSAVGAGLVGVAVIAGLEAPLALRLCGGAAWPLLVGWQLRALRSGWSTCVALRLYADGAVTVLGPDGEWSTGHLEPDGVLLRRWAWVRLRTGNDRPFAEPLRGACRESRDWRRLHVVWRHIGA
jgi:hypothetical protein